MNIPILYDPSIEHDSVWGEEILVAISKEAVTKKYNLVFFDSQNYRTVDYDNLFGTEPRLVLMISTEQEWMEEVFSFFEEMSIRVVMVGPDLRMRNCVQAQVDVDHCKDIEIAIDLLARCGCTRPVLYGVFPNSYSDRQKKTHFENSMRCRYASVPERLCIENISGLTDCYHVFRKHISEYDSLICVNGFAAASLIHHLTADNIRVPDDIQVVTFGGTRLSELTVPALSVISSDASSIGQNAVRTYRYLYNAGVSNLRLTTSLAGELIVRESTKVLNEFPATENRVSQSSPLQHRFYNDEEVRFFDALEKLLTKADVLDFQIIQYLNEGRSYEKMAQLLHLTKNAVFYRIKRMREIAGFSGMNSFRRFISEYAEYFSRVSSPPML